MFAMKHEMHKNHGIFKDINKLLKQEKKKYNKKDIRKKNHKIINHRELPLQYHKMLMYYP